MFAVVSVALASCAEWFPREPLVMDEGPAQFSIYTDNPVTASVEEDTPIGYSLIFNEQDQQVHGVPAVVPFLWFTENVSGLSVDLNAHVHTNENHPIEKPCFGEIGIRNDGTREVVNEIVGFCFPEGERETIYLEHAFDASGPFEWNLNDR